MDFLLYLFKVSLSISIIYLVYTFLLSRLKFFSWNRYFMLAFFLLSFLWPAIDAGMIYFRPEITYTFSTEAYSLAVQNNLQLPGKIALIIFFTGIAYLLTRFVYGLYLLNKKTKSAVLLTREPYPLFFQNKKGTFSWGRKIFIGNDVSGKAALEKIISHEFAHVRQAHFIDVYLTQLLCIITWFNPFSWKLRKAVLNNLEFLADEYVVNKGINMQEYQLELLKSATSGIPELKLSFSSGFQSLKKRFIMMNKKKQNPLQKLRFLLALPLVALMLILFSSSTDVPVTNVYKIIQPDTIPQAKKNEYRRVHVKNGIAIVTLMDGKTESYNLNNSSEKKAFEGKYGELPEPPPPPRPPVQNKDAGQPAPPPPPRAPDVKGEQPAPPPPPVQPPVKRKRNEPAPPPPPVPPAEGQNNKIPPPPPPVPRDGK